MRTTETKSVQITGVIHVRDLKAWLTDVPDDWEVDIHVDQGGGPTDPGYTTIKVISPPRAG